jgi:response regulator RpfG family c-di-GMP phosphodiesterase
MGTDSQRPRILCVDDEPRVLTALRRALAISFEVEVAEGGAAGLEVLEKAGPFAVVVSDMRMPGMDGGTFLTTVRKRWPDTVRILLTGYADLESALTAVNDANVFRFLCKPCPPETLHEALSLAARQYELIHAERELLEQTLRGSIEVLTDILGVVAPTAFSRAQEVERYAAHIAAGLGLEDQWQIQVAALLSHLGSVTVPPETLEKVYAGQQLTESETAMMRSGPETTFRLLAHIPRLRPVAEMIKRQADPEGKVSERVAMGARILTVATEVANQVARGDSFPDALAAVSRRRIGDKVLLDALSDYKGVRMSLVTKAVPVRDLTVVMTLDQDVRTLAGHLVLPKGRELNGTLLERLRNFAKGVGIEEPIRVRLPVASSSDDATIPTQSVRAAANARM